MRAIWVLTFGALAGLCTGAQDGSAGQTCAVTEVAPGVKMRTSDCQATNPAKPVAVRRGMEPLALLPPVPAPQNPFTVLEGRPWPRDRGEGYRVRQ